LTQEWMLKTLLDLGLTQQDAKVYVFLALNGSQEARAITSALKTYKRQVYRTLNRLKRQQIVTASADLPAKFAIVPFDRVLEMMMKANVEEANRLEQEKEKMFCLWNKSIKQDTST